MRKLRFTLSLLLLANLAFTAFGQAEQIRKIIHEDGYQPTPGDVYTLTINFGVNARTGQAQETETVPLLLGTDYELDVPYIGSIDVRGLSYTELQERVTSLVQERVLAAYVSLTLTAPAVYDVFIWGSVGTPGFHTISSINRLIDTLAVAGGVQATGSRRRIELHRDGEVEQFDLVAYLAQGNEDQNPFIRPGDRVFVPVAEAGVRVSGAVVQPGNYEILADETVGDIIDLAGGLLPTAEPDDATISRLNAQNRYQIFEPEPGELTELDAVNGDVITIPATTTTTETVLVEGALHTGPATEGEPRAIPLEPILLEVPYTPGLSVLRLLEQFGGPTHFAQPERSFIIRGTDNTRLPIPDLRELWEARQWDRDIALQPGDRLVIPMKRLVVAVGGQVNAAGAFPFTSGYNVGDYLELAGGVDPETGSPDRLFFVEPDGTRTRVEVDTPVPIGANIYVGRNAISSGSQFFEDLFTVTGWVTGIITVATVIIEFIELVSP